MPDSVVVQIPASTSNCGPGFDTLGLALGLYGKVDVSRDHGSSISYSGQLKSFPEAALDMVREVADAFFNKSGFTPFGFGFDIQSEVPVARGLGSSVVLRGGLLAALNAVAGSPLSKDDLVAIVSDIEGHPDNAAASILGGFTVARYCAMSKQYFGTQRFAIPDDLKFVVVSPDLEIKTDDSRTALPPQLDFREVISSLNSLSYLVAAFASGNYEALSACRIDHIHEPYRLKSIPHAADAIAAGIEAGAFTGWLSGSGSSVLCVASKAKASAVCQAMEKPFKDHSFPFTAYVLSACNQGATILA
ncbi:MAG: homoserine kinase [Verrucomicrobiae bacterium]|nr:homoserine kinase [Verrucomicrobiae bacterium]